MNRDSYKEINFYTQFNQVSGKKQQRMQKLKNLLPLAVTLILLIAVSLFFLIQNFLLGRQLADLQRRSSDSQLVTQVEEVQELEPEHEALLLDVQDLTNLHIAMDSYPAVNSSVLNKMNELSGELVSIVITSYNAQTGQLSFGAVSPQVIDIPTYIRVLEESGLFVTVYYTGYQYNTASATYTIYVECYLDERAGKDTSLGEWREVTP